jgi:serine/threonine protein kinase
MVVAAPSSVEDFLGLLRRSQLIADAQLNECLQRAEGARPETAADMASLLVEGGVLTNYQAAQLLKGKQDGFYIGLFKILERLGFGAVSNVYLCERPVTHARVAIKVMAQLQAVDPTVLTRFYREARASGQLVHPNIVRSHDVDKGEQGHFIVMDFVEGSSIQDIIHQFGPMDINRAAHYIRQAATGLEYANQKSLVHRDINPGNLLIDRQGTVKILDMGLARFLEDEGKVLTQGVVLGTPEYLAPEQALDSHNVDTRADVYGLGATFYYMLTGQPPYAEEKSVAKKFLAKQGRDPQPIREIRPEVPVELVMVVEQMMARDLNRRFRSPAAVAQALTPWTETPIPPPPEREMPQLSPALRMQESSKPTPPPSSKLTPPPGARKLPDPASLPPGPPAVKPRSVANLPPIPAAATAENSSESADEADEVAADKPGVATKTKKAKKKKHAESAAKTSIPWSTVLLCAVAAIAVAVIAIMLGRR